MGSRSRPHRVLSVCVCVCVSRCVWLRLIRSSWESSPLGYISSCHALPLVRSLQFAVDVYEAFLVPGFRDSWALLLSWTPIAGDSSAHCFPALPASAPTESSVSAYGKLRVCLRKLRPSAYGKLRLVSRCVLLLVINSLFPQLNPPVFIVTIASLAASYVSSVYRIVGFASRCVSRADPPYTQNNTRISLKDVFVTWLLICIWFRTSRNLWET